MKIGTFSIVVGGSACNASCPFCISKMTPKLLPDRVDCVNWGNFKRACLLARSSGVTTVLLTSKGEPTLWPELISQYLFRLGKYQFPFIELQTNGIAFSMNEDLPFKLAKEGLSTVALSVVSVKDEVNAKIYTPRRVPPPNLVATINLLHEAKLSVRLTVMMLAGIVDNVLAVDDVIAFCKLLGVEQLTIRPIAMPNKVEDITISNWVRRNAPRPEVVKEIYDYYLGLADSPIHPDVARVLTLSHGAPVLSVFGQNLCLTDCLTVHPDASEEMRQIIFFPDGHIRYDWQYEGAILL